MTKCNEATARDGETSQAMAQQPLGDLGGGCGVCHMLLLLPHEFYMLVIIAAMAVSFPFAGLLCLSH